MGGTLPPPEVMAAMAEAAKAFVVLDELNAEVGEKIAAITGAEAGYVTCGSAAGMLLAAAACITGTDIARIRRLPDTTGMPNEIIVHRAHRINYDQMFRAPGAKLVEIGIPSATERWEYEAAFTERTAAVAFVDSPVHRPRRARFRDRRGGRPRAQCAGDRRCRLDAAARQPPDALDRRGRGPRHLQRRQGDSRPAGFRPARRAGGSDRRRAG